MPVGDIRHSISISISVLYRISISNRLDRAAENYDSMEPECIAFTNSLEGEVEAKLRLLDMAPNWTVIMIFQLYC
jgi:hypothetical protein